VAVVGILLTGFEPFGGSDVNVSMDVVNAFEKQILVEDPWNDFALSRPPLTVDVERSILSVDRDGSLNVAKRIEKGETWSAILHLGVCGTCLVPRIETVAEDRLAMRIPDNGGRQVAESTLSGNGDLAITSPAKHWFQSWKTDAEVSIDAGAYLCNETLYRSLEANREKAIPILFLHLPPEEVYPIEKSMKVVNDVIARMLFKPVIHVVGSLFTEAGKFLLARRAGHERHAGTWEFPGGKMEQGESMQAAIIREIKEEFDWTVTAGSSIGRWVHELEDAVIALDILSCSFIGQQPSYNTDVRWTSHDSVQWHTSATCGSLIFTGSDHEVVERIKQLDLID
jgi:8-oxo-dGTP diphosphatase